MKTKHSFKVLSKKEVEKNRSKKYEYIVLEKLESGRFVPKQK